MGDGTAHSQRSHRIPNALRNSANRTDSTGKRRIPQRSIDIVWFILVPVVYEAARRAARQCIFRGTKFVSVMRKEVGAGPRRRSGLTCARALPRVVPKLQLAGRAFHEFCELDRAGRTASARSEAPSFELPAR